MLFDMSRYLNFAQYSNFVDVIDIIFSFYLGLYDVWVPWYNSCEERSCISCSNPCSDPELSNPYLPGLRAIIFFMAWRNFQGGLVWAERVAGYIIPIVRTANAI